METERKTTNVQELAEMNFVEAPANLSECRCSNEHNLHVALSEQRSNPAIFSPEHVGMKGARCATFGRCR